MILSPFLEGVIIVVLALICIVLGVQLHVSDLTPIGMILIGTGVGYITGHKVEQNNQAILAAQQPALVAQEKIVVKS